MANVPAKTSEEREVVTATERTRALKKKLDGNREAFEQALAGRIEPDRFLRIVANAYLGSSSLQSCSFLSVLTAALDAAEVGLKTDGEEAAIVPYRDRDSGELVATFQPMVQGLIRLMLRAGARKIEARVVRSGDHFRYGYGLDPYLEHEPAPCDERGEVTYAYAVVWLANGERQFEVMDRKELDKIRESAQASNSPAWRNWTSEMFRKSVVKRLRKYVELDSAASAAFRKDDLLEGGKDVPLGEIDPDFERRGLSERAKSMARRETRELSAAVDASRRRITGEESPPSRVPPEVGEREEAPTGEASGPDPEPEPEPEKEEPRKDEGETHPRLDFEGLSEFEVHEIAERLDTHLAIPTGKYRNRTWDDVIREDPDYLRDVVRHGWILEDDELRSLAANLFLTYEATFASDEEEG